MEAAAMATSTHETEETTGPLVGAVQPPDAKDLQAASAAAIRSMLELTETLTRLGLVPSSEPPSKRWFPRLRRLWRRLLVRIHPSLIPIRPNQSLDSEEIEILERRDLPSVWKRLAMDRKLMEDCLDHYNRLHPDNEYEPVLLGIVSTNPHFHNGVCWTHGNFIARKKRFGFLSFLLAPRALFFYERAHTNGFEGVVTCTPVEEPAYAVLGFPLWWATRRNGKLDSFCKTCYCRFGIPRPGKQKISDCGHNNVGEVCEMCYLRSDALHPDPGEFAFGYHHPYHPYPTKH